MPSLLPSTRKAPSPDRPFIHSALVIANIFCILMLGWLSSSRMESFDDSQEYAASDSGPSSTALAKKQSFGFFDDITDEHWKLLQEIVTVHENHKYPDQPLTHNPHFDKRHMKYFNSYPAWWQTNYEPNFSCQFERRIGQQTNGDGPKWVCDPHRIARLARERRARDPNHPGCVVYSIGSNGDFNFEVGVQRTIGPGVCEFHIFDFGDYAAKVPEELQRTHYHQWGLFKQGSPEKDKFYGLEDTVKKLGHENLDVIDIFKIDCEKCEWRTYTDWNAPGIPSLQQILVELHDAPPQVIPFFDNMEEHGYVRFHKEPNIQFNDGSCEEYALLKLDKEFFEPRKERLEQQKLAKEQQG